MDQLYHCFGFGPKVMVGASYAQTVVKLIAGVSINSPSVFFPLHTMGLINGSLSPKFNGSKSRRNVAHFMAGPRKGAALHDNARRHALNQTKNDFPN